MDRMAPRTKKQKEEVPMEEALWKSAEKLRGAVEFSEYKHVVLGLIFLKFVGDKFDEKRAEIIAEGHEKFVDMKEFYQKDNVFYLPPESRWSHIRDNAKQSDLAIKIDTALNVVEKNNPSLKGALPDNYYSRLDLDVAKLSALVSEIDRINTTKDKEEDLIGRVYEYFLSKFSAKEGKGEFYTPKCIVKIITEMIEPYKGRIFDPCCGSGGMFVQSIKFVEAHGGSKKDISIYGQEYIATTLKLAKMNLAIRGISADFGESNGDSFLNDQHKDLKADFIMANPPFNQDNWGRDRLEDDSRWRFGVPPAGNANFAWVQHFISHLSTTGMAGFVLANGSLSSKQSGEGDIRRNLVDSRLVDCIVSLPGQLFYSTGIPVCLWFVSRSKPSRTDDTRNSILFIDCRDMGVMVDRTHKILTDEEIAKVSSTYHAWKSGSEDYQDEKGFCRSSTIDEISEQDYILTPGRYVGIPDEEDDGIPYEEKMKQLTSELSELFKESDRLKEEIKKNLGALGFEL